MRTFDPCVCGHDHTTGRIGGCGTFTCDCKTWRPPEAGPVLMLARKIAAGIDAYSDQDAAQVAQAFLELTGRQS